MKLFQASLLTLFLAAAGPAAVLAQTALPAPATPTPPPSAPAQSSQAELEKLVAPIKILTRQGKHAPGGKYDYLINGHLIGGFAFVA